MYQELDHTAIQILFEEFQAHCAILGAEASGENFKQYLQDQLPADGILHFLGDIGQRLDSIPRKNKRHGMQSVIGTSKGVVLAQKLAHPIISTDDHLSYVLIEKPDGEYVVWLHNSEHGSIHDGFSHGHYCQTLTEAFEIFDKKGL